MNILDGIIAPDRSISMAGPFAARPPGDPETNVIKIEPLAGGITGNRIIALCDRVTLLSKGRLRAQRRSAP
ncbi:hypothetical protein [Paracoccus onubensis]|uniref:Uncharacterized protein n=1 Tax=Paracoccus onubensis TaxID=1675788 RepID=A0A418T3U0_9RHOB|nr:hypothetical protein [Paracoccus onubensis]RJE87864.1 hypothetical protein D3P04_02755 [Paracoccus onubensis]